MLLSAAAAPTNEKRAAFSLNEDVRIYINGQEATFEATQTPGPPWDQYKYVLSSAYLEDNINYLRDAMEHCKCRHPLKPYLETIMKYFQHKLDEADGASHVTFDHVEMCVHYVQDLRGITHKEVPPQRHEFRLYELINTLFRSPQAPTHIRMHILNRWMFLCQRIYEMCSSMLQNLEMENTKNARQEGNGVDATPANFQDSHDIKSSNQLTSIQATKRDIGEHPSSMAANEMVATSYIQGSLGAWNPDTDGLLDDENELGENAASSSGDGLRHLNSTASGSIPEQHDDWLHSYNNSEIAEEDGDPDWDEYFESYLDRLKSLPQEYRPKHPPSRAQRVQRNIRWLRYC
ncbi:Exostosin family isoform 1, putative [Babesia ovata]|uniref:Exostosin family isoform 1, putative n=1 Tax=Babesia ovata TaxID=189622 RepID=A0A2H6KDS1_9APIC|nr:Exostosin family isoform 1, putative [Babesia ovata]GBE61124.1 Exostosin family isoform 1, putative [Babesia ovata]